MSKGLVLISWLFLVLIISIIPVPDTGVAQRNLDKLVHFVIYGVTALFFLKFLYKGFRSLYIDGSISIGLASLYGFLMETIQSFFPYRSFSIGDILFNFFGALFFGIVCSIVLLKSKVRAD